MGIEQTEIDALAALQPQLLEQVAVDAMAPFFDATLEMRVNAARVRWLAEAQAVVDAETDTDQRQRLLNDAADRLDAMREQIEGLNDALRIDADDFDLPEVVIPTAEVDGEGNGLPLLDSRWSFGEQCRALIDSKAYRVNGAKP
jgi:hypothetical protein